MVKGKTIPLTKEEMDKLIESSIENDFYFMLFNVLKTTGRRIGELYGIQEMKETSRKKIGTRRIFVEGKEMIIDVTRAKMQRVPDIWKYGVQVKDIDLDKGIMKVWVLKRREFVQDESVLIPEVAKLIKYYIIREKLRPEDYLFRKYSLRTIQDRVKHYAKKAGIKHNVSVHNFRHYLVTELIRKGYPRDKVAKVTGHKAVQTLAIYDHVLASDMKDELNKDLKDL